jgi:glycosyltransferase involved in cell wall biosynthesis
MLASKPIIASYTGYPSMINEANCGSFVKTLETASLRDELIKFVGMSNKERKTIGENGKKWICSNRKYSTLAQKYIDAIEITMTDKNNEALV